MEYLAVRRRSCDQEFAVERISTPSGAAPFQRPSFKASHACVHCYATNDYSSDDLLFLAGGIENGSERFVG